MTETRILRHRLTDRVLHWVMAAGTLTLLGTGLLPVLGLKFPWVTAHWIAGVVLIAAVLAHSARVLLRRPLISMWIGLRDFRAALRPGTEKPGKYSLAQRLMHQAVTFFTLLAIATGIPMLAKIDTPLWVRDPYVLSQQTWGIIYVLHDIATLFFVSLIMIHVYFALRPEKLFYTRSMVRGFITREEYLRHHDSTRWQAGEAEEAGEAGES